MTAAASDVLGDRPLVMEGVGHQNVRRQRGEVDLVGARAGDVDQPQLLGDGGHVRGEPSADVDVGVAQLVQQCGGSTPTSQHDRRRPGGRAASNRSRCGHQVRSVTTIFIGSVPLQRRTFAVERPARDQVLHGDGVVAGAESLAPGTARARRRPRPRRDRRRGPARRARRDSRRRSRTARLVIRCPSCQIQWVSMAVMSPGAAAATWVNIASDTSKWLLECEPHVSPHASHSCATRTEPFIVQKCGSASGMSTAPERIAWPSLAPVGGDHVGGGRQTGGAFELGHHLAAGEAALGPDRDPRRRPARRSARGTS